MSPAAPQGGVARPRSRRPDGRGQDPAGRSWRTAAAAKGCSSSGRRARSKGPASAWAPSPTCCRRIPRRHRRHVVRGMGIACAAARTAARRARRRRRRSARPGERCARASPRGQRRRHGSGDGHLRCAGAGGNRASVDRRRGRAPRPAGLVGAGSVDAARCRVGSSMPAVDSRPRAGAGRRQSAGDARIADRRRGRRTPGRPERPVAVGRRAAGRPRMVGLVERKLGPLDALQRQTLVTLALAGPTSPDIVKRLGVGRAPVELEARRLIRVEREGRRSLVGVADAWSPRCSVRSHRPWLAAAL